MIKKLFVVLADDDEDDREIFKDALKEIDTTIDFISFVDGQELKEWVAVVVEIPDYIFLDINMPKCTGLDCLNKIRENPQFENCKLIIYSTSVSPTDIETAFERKASLYLIKPNSLTDLIKALKEVFSMNWQVTSTISNFTFSVNM